MDRTEECCDEKKCATECCGEQCCDECCDEQFAAGICSVVFFLLLFSLLVGIVFIDTEAGLLLAIISGSILGGVIVLGSICIVIGAILEYSNATNKHGKSSMDAPAQAAAVQSKSDGVNKQPPTKDSMREQFEQAFLMIL